MFTLASLWIPFTITASLGQVARNAMQRQLTGPLGTWGATNIRFLFGFPFSILFFVVVLIATRDPLPSPPVEFWFTHSTFSDGGVEGGYAQVDDVELTCGPRIFADGFESGLTTHWSADSP